MSPRLRWRGQMAREDGSPTPAGWYCSGPHGRRVVIELESGDRGLEGENWSFSRCSSQGFRSTRNRCRTANAAVTSSDRSISVYRWSMEKVPGAVTRPPAGDVRNHRHPTATGRACPRCGPVFPPGGELPGFCSALDFIRMASVEDTVALSVRAVCGWPGRSRRSLCDEILPGWASAQPIVARGMNSSRSSRRPGGLGRSQEQRELPGADVR
jgi:hypothetical protein